MRDERASRDVAALAGLPEYARVMLRCSSGRLLARAVSACLDRRLVAVPLGPRTPDADLHRLGRRVGAAAVVTDRGGRLTVDRPAAEGTDGATHGAHAADAADGAPEGAPDAAEGAPDAGAGAVELAFVIFTSGSTGEPKGVMLDRASVLGNAAKVAEMHGFGPDRPHATCLPLYHVNALMMSLLGTRLTGAPLYICERFHPEEYFAGIAARGVRTAAIVPALLHRLLDARPPWPDSLDYLITAAAPLTSELAGRFYAAYGPRLRQGYGLTEAVNFSAVMPLLDAAEFRDQYVKRWPPVGLPLPQTELRLSADGRPAGGAGGEVCLQTPDVMRGYWGDPASTADAFTVDGWLRTGDLGELRDGFLVLTGRVREQINRGGTKFSPLHLERQWATAGLTGRFAAVPVVSAQLGQDIGVVLDGGSLLPVRRLGRAGVPPPVAARSGGLLVTATGKLRRAEMGRRLVARHDSPVRYERLLWYARRAAAAICDSPHRPRSALAALLHGRALALVHDTPADIAPPPGRVCGVAPEVLDVLVDSWPALADGSLDGEQMMRAHPGLWKRLMTEWPMGSYAELMSEVLERGRLLGGRVLEVGCGVGNTTSLVADRVCGEFVWSDRSPELVRRGPWPGTGVVFDFDQPPPPGLGGFTAIFATNAVHCAADKLRTLRWLRSMLEDGGTLVLCEGSNPTTPDGRPWALDFLFCAFAGWWDRSGFLTRWDWLSLLEQAGFARLGFAGLRAGEHDLGGVVWGSRAAAEDVPPARGQADAAGTAATSGPTRPHHPDFDGCYGCAPEQLAGLRVRPVGPAGPDSDFVFAVEPLHQGAPGIAHGGVLAAVLDEALGIAAWSTGGPYVTARLETDYLVPVPVGSTLAIRTRRTAGQGRKLYLQAEARLGGPHGPVAVRASALYVRPP